MGWRGGGGFLVGGSSAGHWRVVAGADAARLGRGAALCFGVLARYGSCHWLFVLGPKMSSLSGPGAAIPYVADGLGADVEVQRERAGLDSEAAIVAVATVAAMRISEAIDHHRLFLVQDGARVRNARHHACLGIVDVDRNVDIFTATGHGW